MWNIIDENPISIAKKVAEVSDDYEQTNSELKKMYIIQNIALINSIMQNINGYCGSFGTGYPFYALGQNLTGILPVIDEQIRYNNELKKSMESSKHRIWHCGRCLSENSLNMPDLKQICIPCPKMDDSLKPRKLINRLPDIDMWMICDDKCVEEAKEKLLREFKKHNMYTSDVSPIQTIEDVSQITEDLKAGRMPQKKLPLDIHIISYSEFIRLIEQVPQALKEYTNNDGNIPPYLPIHPISLRKSWQYDDVAYNFILDFLLSLTPFNLEIRLQQRMQESRSKVANIFSNEELNDILYSVATQSVRDRMKTERLKEVFEERMDGWRD